MVWCLPTLAKISAVWQHGLLFSQGSNVGVHTWFADQCNYRDVLLLSGRACTARQSMEELARNRNKWWHINISHVPLKLMVWAGSTWDVQEGSTFACHRCCVAADQACKKMSNVGMFLFLMQILPLLSDLPCCISLGLLAPVCAAVKRGCQRDVTTLSPKVPGRAPLTAASGTNSQQIPNSKKKKD